MCHTQALLPVIYKNKNKSKHPTVTLINRVGSSMPGISELRLRTEGQEVTTILYFVGI